MAALTAGAIWAGVQIGGAVLGGIGRRRGGKAAQSAAMEQADLIRQTTAEAARRMEQQHNRVAGEATAGVHASGLEMSGTQEKYVTDLKAEQARELDWLKKAGEQQARSVEKGGQVQRKGGALRNLGMTMGGIARGGAMFSRLS